MAITRFLLVLLLVCAGCRDYVGGPEVEELPTVLPGLAGEWAGTYDGVLDGLRDTIHVTLNVQAAGVEYGFYGRVRQDAATGPILFDCDVRPVEISTSQRALFACFQSGLQGGTRFTYRVFDLDLRLNAQTRVLDGIVRNGLGFDGNSYPITLLEKARTP